MNYEIKENIAIIILSIMALVLIIRLFRKSKDEGGEE